MDYSKWGDLNLSEQLCMCTTLAPGSKLIESKITKTHRTEHLGGLSKEYANRMAAARESGIEPVLTEEVDYDLLEILERRTNNKLYQARFFFRDNKLDSFKVTCLSDSVKLSGAEQARVAMLEQNRGV